MTNTVVILCHHKSSSRASSDSAVGKADHDHIGLFRCMMGTADGPPKSVVVHSKDASPPSYKHQEVSQVPGRQWFELVSTFAPQTGIVRVIDRRKIMLPCCGGMKSGKRLRYLRYSWCYDD